MQSLEDAATTSRKATNDTTRTAASKGTRVLGCGNVTNGQAEAGKTALQRLLEAINEQRDEMREIIAEQRSMICELRDVVSRQEDAIQELHRQLADAKTQLSEELRQARDQIDILVRNPVSLPSAQTNPRASYAEVTRTLPASQPSGVRTLSLSNATPTASTDTLFCTIDTSRAEGGEKGKVQVADIRKAIETVIQTRENTGSWRCAAVVKKPGIQTGLE
jgi:septal ring factor EnvC (AmiA/AmiB activator)